MLVCEPLALFTLVVYSATLLFRIVATLLAADETPVPHCLTAMLSTTAATDVVAVMLMPEPVMLLKVEFWTDTTGFVVELLTSRPLVLKPKTSTSSTCSLFPARNLMPFIPVHPRVTQFLIPLIEMWRSVTTAVVGLVETLTTTPFVPLARIEAHPDPVPPSIVIYLVIVTEPKPPGSSTSISPPSMVLLIAPPKVLHGAVRLQGSASFPTPDTNVLDACACASEQQSRHRIDTAKTFNVNRVFIGELLS